MSTASHLIIPLAAQLIPLVHLVLAGFATATVLRKRSEVSPGLAAAAVLVAWAVPLLGPLSVLIGLRRPHASQP